MRKVVKWILVNGIMAALVYMALFQGVGWAGNVVKFMLWVTVILYGLYFGIPDSHRPKPTSEIGSRSVPAYVSAVYDFAMALTMASQGWFLYATLALLQGVLYEGIMQEREKLVKQKTEERT